LPEDFIYGRKNVPDQKNRIRSFKCIIQLLIPKYTLFKKQVYTRIKVQKICGEESLHGSIHGKGSPAVMGSVRDGGQPFNAVLDKNTLGN